MSNLSRQLDSVLSSIPDDLDKNAVIAATSTLQQKANEIRSQRINWQSYLQSQMLLQDHYDFIVSWDATTSQQERDRILSTKRVQCADTFFWLLNRVARDQTVSYVLILIDEMLNEDKSRVDILREAAKKNKESVWNPFLNLLNHNDGFIQNMSSRIVSRLACCSYELMEGSELHLYINWLKEQLKIATNLYLQSVARCLQMMLRIDEYRLAFVASDGIQILNSVLQGKSNFQIQYQIIFCMWIMSFNPVLTERMSKHNIIPSLSDILAESGKEKVTRIILATLRNFIEKIDEPEVARDNAITMVQCKALKQLEMMVQNLQKYEDPDIKEDIEFLVEKLRSSVQDLSSFDEYSTELKSGRLEWSPVHNSEKFWRENADKLNEKNYELLKILIRLLETSKDPLVLSVASHDLGEYVRHYPRGKVVAENLGGKHLVMQLLAHEDPNVRYEALLCVQKLMVQNWEYLGKQLEKETGSGKTGGSRNGTTAQAVKA